MTMDMDDDDRRHPRMAMHSPRPIDVADEELSEHARPRKRTRRACDKCSNSRTRCNGECPCRRCVDYGYTCRYNREVKKRGRVPISVSSTTGHDPSAKFSTNTTTTVAAARSDQKPSGGGKNAADQKHAIQHQSHPQVLPGPATRTSPSIASPPTAASPPSVTPSSSTMSYFAHPQTTHSYGADSSLAGADQRRLRLNGRNGTHAIYARAAPGPREPLSSPQSVSAQHPTLPSISLVPNSSAAATTTTNNNNLPAYLPSLSSPSGGAYQAAASLQMQLAAVLDSSAPYDHNSILGGAAPPTTYAHQPRQRTSSPTLSRIIQHQAGSSPAGPAPSIDGSQLAGSAHGAHAGSIRETVASDESIGYPSPANGPGSCGHGGISHRASVSFSAGSSSATGPGSGPGPNPMNDGPGHDHAHGRGRLGSVVDAAGAASGSGGFPDMQRVSSLYKAPSSDCRYAFLLPVLPYIADIIPASVACDLLDVYLTEPGSSLFRCASPYILTRIFRKRSLLHRTHPRPTTPALLATMLWCAAQTADIVLLHVPGSRSKITNALYELSTSLISQRDPDRWRRIHGGLRVENDQSQSHYAEYIRSLNGGNPPALGVNNSQHPTTTATNEPGGVIDDVLTFVLLSIAVSGGDFKSDCFKWWNKAIRLTLALGLHREDERCSASVSPCANPLCSCRREREHDASLSGEEAREERRRVFWLVYCLDRHLALSFNSVLYIPDSYCELYTPLPETVWEELDTIYPAEMPKRVIGPPTTVTGTGFFEYFLPLMAILGDIIEIHHRRSHPRLGSLEDSAAVAVVSEQLAACERSLDYFTLNAEEQPLVSTACQAAPDYMTATTATMSGGGPAVSPTSVPRNNTPGPHIRDLVTGGVGGSVTETAVMNKAEGGVGGQPASRPAPLPGAPVTAPGGPDGDVPTGQRDNRRPSVRDRSRMQLVMAYSTHILHVLHVLLHGKWDAISMLDDDDDWITSARFNNCAASAIAASQAVSRILQHDPELTFMPYLFGIYLLHGSFILLLFADRMPQLGGPNQSVEQACETIVRAHEVCVVTLSTEFQKNFRKVLRSTLYSVRGSSPTEWEEHKARRRALSLYRWTKGAKGLAL